MTVKTFTEEEMIQEMEKIGVPMGEYFWDDACQYYRLCIHCNRYASVDDISENICDNCSDTDNN